MPDGDYVRFLTQEAGVPLEPGDFLDPAAASWAATGGSRPTPSASGGGWASPPPIPSMWPRKDPVRNTVTLAEDRTCTRSALVGREVNWIPFDAPAGPLPVTAKTRYSQAETPRRAYASGGRAGAGPV